MSEKIVARRSHNFTDLTGQVFDRLTVRSYEGRSDGGKARWLCSCQCGGSTVTTTNLLRSGKTRSCGCFQKEIRKKNGQDKLIDLCGRQFGRLTVIGLAGVSHCGTKWLCRCTCGKTKVIEASNLRRTTRSCGCLRHELNVSRKTTHGKSKTVEYSIWTSMMSRCYSQQNKSWLDYGGRGIKVCERWHDVTNFITDMGLRPSSRHEIDRKENDGDYCPENCHWITKLQNMQNTRQTVKVSWQGDEISIAELARRTGINYKVLHSRISRGMPAETAVAKPIRKARK